MVYDGILPDRFGVEGIVRSEVLGSERDRLNPVNLEPGTGNGEPDMVSGFRVSGTTTM